MDVLKKVVCTGLVITLLSSSLAFAGNPNLLLERAQQIESQANASDKSVAAILSERWDEELPGSMYYLIEIFYRDSLAYLKKDPAIAYGEVASEFNTLLFDVVRMKSASFETMSEALGLILLLAPAARKHPQQYINLLNSFTHSTLGYDDSFLSHLEEQDQAEAQRYGTAVGSMVGATLSFAPLVVAMLLYDNRAYSAAVDPFWRQHGLIGPVVTTVALITVAALTTSFMAKEHKHKQLIRERLESQPEKHLTFGAALRDVVQACELILETRVP